MDLTKFGVENSKTKKVDDTSLSIEIDSIKEDYHKEVREHYLPWFIKYQLSSMDDVIETKEIKKVRDFFENFQKGKGLVLVGSPGSGKTTTLQLFGNHYNYEIYELNASDTRNKSAISDLVKDVVNQRSLFNQEKILLIDEVDGVSGTKDRGGVAELIKLLKTSKYPFVFTANNHDAQSLKALKKVCTIVDFEAHSYELLDRLAKKILENEGIEYEELELKAFVEKRVTSDIRGFINDLQTAALSKNLSGEDMEIRDYKQKIDSVLRAIFYGDSNDAIHTMRNSDVDLDDLALYLEENIPRVYDSKGMYCAMNELSKADVFKGRIRTWQYWRYLVYINFYLTFGVNSCGKPISEVKFKRNERILKKWIYGNKVNALRARTRVEKSKNAEPRFIEQLAHDMGCSVTKLHSTMMPTIRYLIHNDKNFKKDFITKYSLDAATIQSLEEL